MSVGFPRLVVAGTGGDSGKTLVSLGLAAAWRRLGLRVAAFKKGPDYIDAAWLARASGHPARNLDAWLMGEEGVRRSFARHAAAGGVNLIEGNRGVLDGLEGTSTSGLAKVLDAPVVLVIDITKTTRTAAAVVAGVRALEPDLLLAGVILNRVGGPRHAREATAAIEEATGVPVLGALPRIRGEEPLPDRHLGLVPPEEHDRMDAAIGRIADFLPEHADLDTLLEIARAAAPWPAGVPEDPPSPAAESRVRVGVFRDPAFTFYYPENLEALAAAGAELIVASPLADGGLPEMDLLYIGGGFPETHAPDLAENRPMLAAVRAAARGGLPIYAECGGLIYLARSVSWRGRTWNLSGVLELEVTVHASPRGHGYAEVLVDAENPFFPRGTVLRGHEFHYSAITAGGADQEYAFAVRRGTGSHAGRDGIVSGNVLATWVHLHAAGTPDWAPALVARARERMRGTRTGTTTNMETETLVR